MKRKAYFDILNLISCYSVLCLHHNGLVHRFTPTSSWAQALVVEVVFYFAVPVFFMLSGATLLGYGERYSLKKYYWKRIQKTVVPFLFWTFVWGIVGHGVFMLDGVIDGLNAVLSSRFCGIYWFFVPLFWLYLLVPILAKIAETKKTLEYSIVITFILGSLIPLLNRIFGIVGNVFVDNSCMYVCMYALLGYYLSKYNLNPGTEMLIIPLAFLMLVIRYVVTYYCSYKAGEVDRTLFSYAYPTAVLPAVSVFILGKKVDNLKFSDKVCSVLKTLSSCSFGVYLIHPFFTMKIWPKTLRLTLGLGTDSLLFRLILIPVTYILSVSIVYLCRKIKVFKLIFP